MNDDLRIKFFDIKPKTWADAFPWIAAKTANQRSKHDAWWDSEIDDMYPPAQKPVVEKIADLIIERISSWALGDAMPGLPEDLVLAELDLPVRATNVLKRENLVTSGDIAELTAKDLFKLRNAGAGTVKAILVALIEVASSESQATIGIDVPEDFDGFSEPDPWISQLLTDIETLASWHQSLGHGARGIFTEIPTGAPINVIEARDRMLSLSADRARFSKDLTLAECLDTAINQLGDRYNTLLTKRLFAWNSSTLDEIGQDLGVTRERARQLEAVAIAKLIDYLNRENPIGQVARYLRAQIRGVRPLTELLAEVPALEEQVFSVGQAVWRVLDVLDDKYEIADGWCAEPNFETVRRDTAILLEELADSYGVVRLSDVSLHEDSPVSPNWIKNWLTYLGYEVIDQFVLIKTSSLNDRAAACLSIEADPLTIGEIHNKVGRGTLNSLKNVLQSDPIFTRVGLDLYALAEWGLDGYTNIRGAISKLLEGAAGEMPLDEVIASLVESFGVSGRSVEAYARKHPFQVLNGIVRLDTGQTTQVGKNPAKTRRYYCRGEDWLHRTTVTFDHLRGSGWAASTALATILRMLPGENVELASRLGAQSFSYKQHQPAYGSIKRFIEDMDLGIGDEIFLVIRSDNTFDVERLPDVPQGKLAQALRLIGADPHLAPHDAVVALGSAIKYSADADIKLIAEGYKIRREPEIHDLILGI